MSEATQTYLTLGSEEADNGFYSTLDYIRENANTQYGKGRLFERLIRTYLLEDPFYQKRFSEVYLWSEWAELRQEFDGVDIGIDLVAQERDGGYCAIQCKCYAENTRISKGDLDTFISASAREPFTARMFVDTGSDWNVLRALRSHDDRLNAEINRIDLNNQQTNRIIFSGFDEDGEGTGSLNEEQLFLPIDLPPGAIFAKIVERCGDRKYWESWAANEYY